MQSHGFRPGFSRKNPHFAGVPGLPANAGLPAVASKESRMKFANATNLDKKSG